MRRTGTFSEVINPPRIELDPHFPPAFYAALWGLSESTAVKWFRDEPGVLKLQKVSKNGKRSRVELRIPYRLAMQVYAERSR
jgi:hypothetical protein